GASACGVALPFLRAQATGGEKGAVALIERLQEDLKKAMFLAGCRNIRELTSAKYVLEGDLYAWTFQRKLL
ncbi:alpha-hydroxy-acid oxidizing protein, partial [archaeon]|nr:alpha-hydroxy-acid oxidizing protein [archaeon]